MYDVICIQREIASAIRLSNVLTLDSCAKAHLDSAQHGFAVIPASSEKARLRHLQGDMYTDPSLTIIASLLYPNDGD